MNGIGEFAENQVFPLGLGLDLPSEGLGLIGDKTGKGVYVGGSYSIANGSTPRRTPTPDPLCAPLNMCEEMSLCEEMPSVGT